MMIDWNSLGVFVLNFAVPLLVFFVTLFVGFFLRRILVARLERWAEKTKSPLDDIIIHALEAPFVFWFFILAVYLGFEVSNLPENILRLAGKGSLALIVLSVTWVVATIAGQLVKFYAVKIESALPVTSLTQNIAKGTILLIGVLIILNSLGISIAPILATLGVGGLAVALALQDTLSNLFAGFHIIVTRQIQIGDYIKMESGEEGYVIDINWRTTKIKMLPNNVVLIPNTKLAQAIVTNYYLPDKELAVLVNLGVHYDSDLNHVEKVTCEVAKEVMEKVPGGVPAFVPFIRFHTLGDFSVNFTVILRAKEFADQHLIKHEFIRRVLPRYRQEGIIIPYPIRTVLNAD